MNFYPKKNILAWSLSHLSALSSSDPSASSVFTLSRLGLWYVLSFLILAIIQSAGPDIVGHDGYYHIKIAELMLSQGARLEFPWLHYTVLDQGGYTDHHFILHGIQSAFVFVFGDLRFSAKWSAVAIAAAALVTVIEVLRRYRVNWPLFWLVVLFCASVPFLYRMSMPRGPSLSLIFQVIAFYMIVERRYVLLAILSGVFVWAYNGFAILLPLTVIGFAVHAIVDRSFEYKLIVSVAVGVLLGLLTHPYFPADILFLWHHVVPKLFTADYVTSVGNEWYPYTTWKWLTTSAVAVLGFLFSLFITDWRKLIRNREWLYCFLVTLMYFVLFIKSRRFAEYYPPMAVMLLALSTRDWDVWSYPLKSLRGVRAISIAAAGAICLAVTLGWTVIEAREDVTKEKPYEKYQGAAQWLAANTPAGATIFHTDWDDFPRLFHFNTHNRYIVGLDPDFMRLHNPELFELWERTSKGKNDDIAAAVAAFDSRYVFTDRKHKKFIRKISKDERFREAYIDPWARIYVYE